MRLPPPPRSRGCLRRCAPAQPAAGGNENGGANLTAMRAPGRATFVGGTEVGHRGEGESGRRWPGGGVFGVLPAAPGRFAGGARPPPPSVTHTHSPFLMGSAGQYAARRLRLPLVFTHHTMYSEYVHYVPLVSQRFSGEVVTRYTIRYCNRCSLVIAPSHA